MQIRFSSGPANIESVERKLNMLQRLVAVAVAVAECRIRSATTRRIVPLVPLSIHGVFYRHVAEYTMTHDLESRPAPELADAATSSWR